MIHHANTVIQEGSGENNPLRLGRRLSEQQGPYLVLNGLFSKFQGGYMSLNRKHGLR
jgi:hypothetical protein